MLLSKADCPYQLEVRFFSPGVFTLHHPLYPNETWGEMREGDDAHSVIASYQPTTGLCYKHKNISFPSWEVAMNSLTIGANRGLY